MRRTRWLVLPVGILAGLLPLDTGWATLVTGAGTLLAVAFVGVLLARQLDALRVPANWVMRAPAPLAGATARGRRPSPVRLVLRALATARPGPRTP
jgi:hypothetical protein